MKPFNPPFYFSNKHIQTLYPAIFRKVPSINIEKEIFELSDGDFIECAWCEKPTLTSNSPIVLLFHGLEGSYKSPYIKGIMLALKKVGLSSVIVHFRGCGDKENRKARAYNSGDTSDAKEYLSHLKILYPNNSLHAIGYSMGGNVLLKLVAEYGDYSPLKSAISISAPMQLNISADTINKGFSRIYQYHLLKSLKQTLIKKYDKHQMEDLINFKKENIKDIKSIWEFDEIYTSKIDGFSTASNYYKLSSSKQYLKNITIPTLIIHSLDDPFMSKDILPSKEELSSSIKLEVYKNGGHVGFVSGNLFKPVYWLEERIVEWFSKVYPKD